MQTMTLEQLVNMVFDKWTCTKTKPNNAMLRIARDPDRILCVLSTNPYTNNTQAMNAMPNNFSDTSLCVYGDANIYMTHHVFFDIVQDILNEIFGLSIKEEPESERVTHIAKYGRQFMAFVDSLRSEIIDLCDIKNFSNRGRNSAYSPKDNNGFDLDYNPTIYREDPDDWFNSVILLKEPIYKNIYQLTGYQEHNYNGDELTKDYYPYEDDCSVPFREAVGALAALVWDKLNPQFVKYTDVFGEVPAAIDDDDINQNPLEFIKNNCKDLEMLNKSITYGQQLFHNTTNNSYYFDHAREKRYITFVEDGFSLKDDAKDLKSALNIIKYWDSEFLFSIAAGLRNLLEY